MAFDENRAKVMRAAGAASAAAPYVRRIMSDSELRDDLRALVIAGHHLYEGLTENGVSKLLEDDVRTDLDHIVSSLQAASERVIRPQRSTRLAAWVVGGTLIGGAVAGLLIYPGTRKPILRSLGLSDGDPWIDTASDNGGIKANAEKDMVA
jgi:hypothetical protein